jgi:hypothetical protein
MKSLSNRLTVLSVAGLLLVGGLVGAAEATAPAEKKVVQFGTLEAMNADTAKAKAADWLKSTDKNDAAALKAFDALWASDRPTLDKVAETFALGNADAAKILAEARDPSAPAPTAVPDLLKDLKTPAFFRANLTLAYAKALATRRVHEEALEVLKLTKAEQVVDPATYLFHRAVAEHALMLREEANHTIVRLLDDVVDAPERYQRVAALMVFDMAGWQDKDLGWVSRMMDNIERRLDLVRGGPKTQDMQKKVVVQLDEMIKKLEDEACKNCQGGNCNKPGQKAGKNPNNNIRASRPQDDSYGGNGSGPGNVDPKKFKELAKEWGQLPEKERAKAIQDLPRNLPPQQRELIENYFKKLAQAQNNAAR